MLVIMLMKNWRLRSQSLKKIVGLDKFCNYVNCYNNKIHK
jgi:hypothetical protein